MNKKNGEKAKIFHFQFNTNGCEIIMLRNLGSQEVRVHLATQGRRPRSKILIYNDAANLIRTNLGFKFEKFVENIPKSQ